MAARPISLLCKGLYLTLVLAAGLLAAPGADTLAAKAKTEAPPAAQSTAQSTDMDPLTEWELVNGAANELHDKIKQRPRDEVLREQMTPLAVRSAIGAERALAIGNASLFDSY